MAKTKSVDAKKSVNLKAPSIWSTVLRGITKLSLSIAIICIIFLSLGFVWYSYQTKNFSNIKTPPKSDAIVVLTGGANRIQTAFSLMDKNLGDRLLITGVNWRTSKSAIFSALNRDIKNSKITVDLDHLALDTIGNANETAHWAKKHDYKKLIIITSSFHISRSLLEFELAMPNIELIPYPAFTDRIKNTDQNLRSDLKEYGKLVATTLRILIFEHLPLTKQANAY